MADIELVVKIPESIWVAIQNGEYCGILDDRTYNAIKNGIQLENVKAEIERKCCITAGRENDPAITLYDVFQIIDKYRGKSDCHSCKAEYDCYECEKYEESEMTK